MNFDKLWRDMLAAMNKALEGQWNRAKGFATSEAKKLAQTLVDIAEMVKADEITQAQARLLMDMQKGAARSVVLAIEGIGIIAAEQALSAALGVVGLRVNKAVGFDLINAGSI